MDGLNVEQERFDLKRVLDGATVPDRVFLNWYRFDRIDEICVADLEESFEYLWYPSSDDLEVLHPNLDWIVTICHYGNIQVLDLSKIRPV